MFEYKENYVYWAEQQQDELNFDYYQTVKYISGENKPAANNNLLCAKNNPCLGESTKIFQT